MTKTFFTRETGRLGGLDLHTVKSPALGQRADVCVYRPDPMPPGLPVVILLHGVYGSHWAWAVQGKAHLTLQRLIDEKLLPPMLLVMPSDGLFQDGSGYLPHHAADYESWIARDVPALVRQQYPEVQEDSPFFLAGLSMGGYGALRIGARYPDTFRAFSGLSSITEFAQFADFVQDFPALTASVRVQECVLDVLWEHQTRLRPFGFDCGRQDPLFEANTRLHQELLARGVPHEFEVHEGGHTWDYWENHLAETLLFFARNLNDSI
ncbi:alpha/beta hydrolase [Dyadobacter jiangsuensis]